MSFHRRFYHLPFFYLFIRKEVSIKSDPFFCVCEIDKKKFESYDKKLMFIADE